MQDKQIKHFSLQSVKGFSYLIPNATIITEYPRLGVITVLKNSLRFYDGERMDELYRGDEEISTLTLKNHLLAIGQKMYKGQLTTTTVLNLHQKKSSKYKYQKTKMQSISISKNCNYLSSVGSSDMGKQQFFIIDLTVKYEIGFKQIHSEQYLQKQKNQLLMVQFSHLQNNLLALLFANRLVLMQIQDQRVLQRTAKANKVREFSMIIFDPYNKFCYLSSKNGDISEIGIKETKEMRIGPRKRVIISGIKHIRFANENSLIITGVKGFIALVELEQMKIIKEVTIQTQIISLTEFINNLGFVTTKRGQIFILNAETLDIHAFYTCHQSKITGISFPGKVHELFGSSAGSQIIIWNTQTLNPLLRIKLKNKICLCLELSPDGKSIISGWNDDCIRFFNPVTGKENNKIIKANNSEVTALKITPKLDKIVSGGKNGSIRIWNIEKQKFGIIDFLFTGHLKEVHSFYIDNTTLYSCSEDGQYGIWDLLRGQKKLMVSLSNFITQIQSVNQYQMVCIGSGSKVLLARKHDGKINNQLKIENASHLNAFGKINSTGGVFYIFGGQLPKVIIHKHYGDGQMFKEPIIEEYDTFGEIVKICISPDNSSMIIGTVQGTLLKFRFESEGTADPFRKNSTDIFNRIFGNYFSQKLQS